MNWEVCARDWPLTPQRVVSQLLGRGDVREGSRFLRAAADGPVAAFNREEGVARGRGLPDAARGRLVLAAVVPGQRLDDEVGNPGDDLRELHLDRILPAHRDRRGLEADGARGDRGEGRELLALDEGKAVFAAC